MKKLILFFTILFFGCKKEIISYPPNNIEIIYSKPNINYPMSLGCGWPKNKDSLAENYKYLRIYDKTYIDKFLMLYNNYEIDTTNFGADVRIKILVHQSLKTDTLCLGENFGVIKNGKSMKDSKMLLNFIKQKIEYYRK